MKKILIFLLIFNFQSLTKANEINELQLEGISVGESLLNYIDSDSIKNKLKSKRTGWYPNKTFAVIELILDNFTQYEDLGVIIKPNDKNYEIYALEGTLYFNDNDNKCREKQNEISSSLKDFFKNESPQFIASLDQNYTGDKSGNSKVDYLDFYFKDNSAVRIICWFYGDEMKKKGYETTLAVAINSKKFMDWVDENM